MPILEYDGERFRVGAEMVLDQANKEAGWLPFSSQLEFPTKLADTWQDRSNTIYLPGKLCADPATALDRAIAFACLNWDAHKNKRKPQQGDKVGDLRSMRLGKVVAAPGDAPLHGTLHFVEFEDGKVELIHEEHLVFMP